MAGFAPRKGERRPTPDSWAPHRSDITSPPVPDQPAPGSPFPARLRAVLTLPRLLLLLIAALAATAYAWSLDTDGLEAYYAAGVRSMAGSWHAFFYDAFDPHATTTLDKLPGAFWVQALSVRLFGYSMWSLVVPQVVESTLTVLVLYRAVRRTAGTSAGLIAAALLAASPVTIASTRGNLSEPLYLLCLVLAADATLRMVVEKRGRSGIAVALWVALAFQAKMTEAWLMLPALVLALVAGAAAGRRRAALRGGLVALAAAVLSLTWMCAFALTPASARPVADGSSHNSVFEQVFLYNGGLRLGSGTDFNLKPLAAPSESAEKHAAANAEQAALAGFYPSSDFSRPGWDRLFAGGLAPDSAWFLPAAVGGAAALFALRRRAGRGDPARAAAVLWSVWLLLYGGAFSAVYHLHDYYLATLVPAIAALTAISLTVLWRAARDGVRAARLALPALIATQAVWSALLLAGQGLVLPGVVLLTGAGATAGTAVLLRDRSRAAEPTLAEPEQRLLVPLTALLTAVAALAGPLAAAGWLLSRAGGPFDTPFAATGTMARPSATAAEARTGIHGVYGGALIPEESAARWSRLMATMTRLQQAEVRQGTSILVFQTSMASSYVMGGLAQIRPIGGFGGNLPYPTVVQVDRLLADGKISLALVPGPNVPRGSDPRVLAIKSRCRLQSADSAADALLYNCRP